MASNGGQGGARPKTRQRNPPELEPLEIRELSRSPGRGNRYRPIDRPSSLASTRVASPSGRPNPVSYTRRSGATRASARGSSNRQATVTEDMLSLDQTGDEDFYEALMALQAHDSDQCGPPVKPARVPQSEIRRCDFCHKEYRAVAIVMVSIEELKPGSPARICLDCKYTPPEALEGELVQEQPGWFVRKPSSKPKREPPPPPPRSWMTDGKPETLLNRDPDPTVKFFDSRLTQLPIIYNPAERRLAPKKVEKRHPENIPEVWAPKRTGDWRQHRFDDDEGTIP